MQNFINDRRRTKRYDIPLKLTYCDPITNCRGEALTRNICRAGIRFPVDTKIAKGAILDVRIEDPYSNASISSKLEVIWLEEFITGGDAEDVIYEAGARLLKGRLY